MFQVNKILSTWLTDVLRSKRRELRKAERKWRRSHLDSDHQTILSKFSVEVTTAKPSFYKRKLEESESDPHKLFSIFSSLSPSTLIPYPGGLYDVLQQPNYLPTGSHPIHTAPVNLPGPATLHLLPYKLFPVTRSCSTGLQDCQSGSYPEETLAEFLRHQQLQTLLSFLSKILKRVVYNQLSFFLSQNQLRDINQSGFKPAHSTESALMVVAERLHTARSVKLSSLLNLLDLSAAFNTVNHKILLSVLTDLGITHTAWKWLELYLEDSHYQVCNRISACLTDISSWMTAHHLKLNPSKTELLFIPSTTGLHHDLTISLGNSLITPTEDATSLGVIWMASYRYQLILRT
ncbi:hypothetical protein NFI96_008551 [Prochilodus magdalenae]|nr:hypothetical protein NFI96_008551 [Prochilodus magdalenae]